MASTVESPAAEAATIVPTNQIDLTLLLISGLRHTFRFSENTTVAQVKSHVFEYWPKEWHETEMPPSSADALRLVYLGRFLDNDSTLEANRIQPGQSTIVHLVIKQKPASLAGCKTFHV